MKNKWYNNQSIRPNQFMWDLEVDPTEIQEIELTKEDVNLIRELVVNSPDSKTMHKCISVYRDVVVIDNNIYHLCLSCGDMRYRSEIKYFTPAQRDELQKLKNKFFPNEK